jgi:maleate isomerase
MTKAQMIDPIGYRAKFGVLVPSTNTVVENEFSQMTPTGVSNNTGRFHVDNIDLKSDEDFESLIEQVKKTLDKSVEDIVTCDPDMVVLGMSAETFWEGIEGSHKLKSRISKIAGGRPVVLGSEACQNALKIFGAKRIAVLTPYWPVGDTQVRKFFSEIGMEITALKGLKATSPIHIACQKEQDLVQSLVELNDSNPDVIVQVGTNLCLAKIAAEAERWLAKPVVAINTAIYHFALRQSGIKDRVQGFGSLLADH